MSMLAEPRRKQKWSLNPRGKEWSQDANKFGQKLLEKMGWKNGKGLGAKENGITEHVKVSYKNDSAGMGYKDSNDQWTEHESNFSALLQSLTCEETDISTIKLCSLEEKSQASRARVHYHKFTRGKDLSRASEKDLASIFGKKSLKSPVQNVTETSQDSISQSETEKNSSELLVNAGSMADYFKKKLPSFGKTNRYVVGSNGVLKMEECEILRPTFGFGYVSSKLKSNDTSEETGNNKRKIDSDSEKSKKRLKKDDDFGVSNPAYNPMSTPIKIKKRILNPIAEEVDENSNTSETRAQIEETNLSDDLTQLKKKVESNENEIKPKKRKNKIIVEVHENNCVDTLVNTNSKKKKKVKQLEVDNPTFNETEEIVIESSNIEENPYEIKPKKKKKAKHLELDNPVFNETEDVAMETSNIEENPYEIKLKKKKKTKQSEDNPTFNETEEVVMEESNKENPYEIKPKKKKTKRLEIDNPTFNESNEVDMETSNIEVNPYEIKPKKKKKNKSLAIDNLGYTENQEQPKDDSNKFEVVSKKKKKKDKGLTNPALDLSNSSEINCDLVLNVISTPITQEESLSKSKTDEKSNKRTKDLQQLIKKKSKRGVDNRNFNKEQTQLDENVDAFAKTIDNCQAEVENDLNEAKNNTDAVTVDDIMVGEVGNPHGDHEQLPEGTKLKFRLADLNNETPFYHINQMGPKKSYKHLIKGDILLTFKNTNLHEVKGYGGSNKL